MICEKCGAPVADGAQFCEACGAKMGQTAAPAEKKGLTLFGKDIFGADKKLTLFALIGVAVVAIILAIILSVTSGPDAKALKFTKCSYKENKGKAIVNLVNKKVLNEYLDEADLDKDDVIDSINDQLEENAESLEDDDVKLSFKVLDENKVVGDSLEDLQDRYDDDFDVKVSAAKYITIKITAKADDNRDWNYMQIRMVKIGAGWYLDVYNLRNYINLYA